MSIPSIGLIGFGAISRALHKDMAARGRAVRWTALMRPDSTTGLPPDVTRVTDVQALIAARPAAVVEAAGAEALRRHLPELLAAGLAVIPASVGALADCGFHDDMRALAARTGGRIVLQGGALGGLDYLAAVAPLPDARARYTSRKPVAAWAAELAALGVDPGALAGPHVLFRGSPADAARLYPRNLNAGLTLALALGPDRVSVRVLADPAATGNTHEIEVTSAAGTAEFRFVNAPAPENPKTSLLTALGMAAALEPFLDRPRT